MWTTRRKFDEWNFRRTAKQILQTAPLSTTQSGPLFVSLVCHKDLFAYLIAIKSVYSRINRGRIIVLNDGSLTSGDKAVLCKHLDDPTFYHVDDIEKGPCPTYICWARLLLIADLCQSEYVIQVDSDIVAQAPIPDIIECIDADTGFIIVNPQHPGRATFREMSAWIEAKDWPHDSVQLRAERGMKALSGAGHRFYVRGSAAFVGFPKQSISRKKIYRFSQEIEPIAGELWRQWGSEQTATNHVVGDMQHLRLLEYPDFVNNAPHLGVEKARIAHFFGTHRYIKGRYVTSTRQALADLKAA